jgi:hypothetical protein
MENLPDLARPKSKLSLRAAAVVRGLRRTGRGRMPPAGDVDNDGDHRWIRMNGARVFYFVSATGDTILRGPDFASAEPLQAGFIDAMARIGGFINAEIETPAS